MASIADMPGNRAAHDAQTNEGYVFRFAHDEHSSCFLGCCQPLAAQACLGDQLRYRCTLMQLLDRPGFLRLMRAAFWIALLGSVVLAIIPQPPDLGTSGFGDKFNHILAFATLTVLACLGFPNA